MMNFGYLFVTRYVLIELIVFYLLSGVSIKPRLLFSRVQAMLPEGFPFHQSPHMYIDIYLPYTISEEEPT